MYSAYYADDADRRNPLMSPLYGDLAGLPPLFLSVGSEECMLHDSVRFAEKARDAGVAVDLRIGRGMVHCYPVLSPFFPEATDALEEICAFLALHAASTG